MNVMPNLNYFCLSLHLEPESALRALGVVGVGLARWRVSFLLNLREGVERVMTRSLQSAKFNGVAYTRHLFLVRSSETVICVTL